MPLNKALGNSDTIILCTQCLNVFLNKCPHAWIFPKVLQHTTQPCNVTYSCYCIKTTLCYYTAQPMLASNPIYEEENFANITAHMATDGN